MNVTTSIAQYFHVLDPVARIQYLNFHWCAFNQLPFDLLIPQTGWTSVLCLWEVLRCKSRVSFHRWEHQKSLWFSMGYFFYSSCGIIFLRVLVFSFNFWKALEISFLQRFNTIGAWAWSSIHGVDTLNTLLKIKNTCCITTSDCGRLYSPSASVCSTV